jgi:hypothetical protein
MNDESTKKLRSKIYRENIRLSEENKASYTIIYPSCKRSSKLSLQHLGSQQQRQSMEDRRKREENLFSDNEPLCPRFDEGPSYQTNFINDGATQPAALVCQIKWRRIAYF